MFLGYDLCRLYNFHEKISRKRLICFWIIVYIAEKENLCLYGLPNETWEVNLPAEEVPPELPEPALGINFARDGMDEKDWLSLVAVHSDTWLLAVAFYFGARFGFDKESRYYICCSGAYNFDCQLLVVVQCGFLSPIFNILFLECDNWIITNKATTLVQLFLFMVCGS